MSKILKGLRTQAKHILKIYATEYVHHQKLPGIDVPTNSMTEISNKISQCMISVGKSDRKHSVLREEK
jgi:hypothetical protein